MTARAHRPAAPPPARSRAVISIAIAAILLLAVAGGAFFLIERKGGETGDPSKGAGPLAEAGLVTKVESLYNDIYVYKEANGNYILSFGARRLRYVESEVNPRDELDLPVYYTQSMTAGLAYAGALDDAMIIGLGGGRTAWYHHKSVAGLEMTAVELDPEVARLAETYFGVKPEPGFDIDIVDGRVFLARSDKRFDIIMVDAYRGPFVPFHLLTAEFYKLVAEHLKPGGVAVQNVEPTTMLFDPAVATIKTAFEHVDFYEGHGNIVIVAYNGPRKDDAALKAIAAERQAKYGFRYDLAALLGRRFTPPYDDSAKPLTDDFAPVEYLKAVTRHNEKQK